MAKSKRQKKLRVGKELERKKGELKNFEEVLPKNKNMLDLTKTRLDLIKRVKENEKKKLLVQVNELALIKEKGLGVNDEVIYNYMKTNEYEALFRLNMEIDIEKQRITLASIEMGKKEQPLLDQKKQLEEAIERIPKNIKQHKIEIKELEKQAKN